MFYPGLCVYLHLEIKMRILSHWQVQHPFFNRKKRLQHGVYLCKRFIYIYISDTAEKKILEANK